MLNEVSQIHKYCIISLKGGIFRLKIFRLIEAELNDICQGVGLEENEEMVTEYKVSITQNKFWRSAT